MSWLDKLVQTSLLPFQLTKFPNSSWCCLRLHMLACQERQCPGFNSWWEYLFFISLILWGFCYILSFNVTTAIKFSETKTCHIQSKAGAPGMRCPETSDCGFPTKKLDACHGISTVVGAKARGYTVTRKTVPAAGPKSHSDWSNKNIVFSYPHHIHSLAGGFKHFYVHPYWGRFPFWLIFFQMGWNHQPDSPKDLWAAWGCVET